MRPIDADKLYEKACSLEAQALNHIEKIMHDEERAEEWKIWSAILAERTAFKHDVFDASCETNIVCDAIEHFRRIIEATDTEEKYNEGFVDGLEFCISHLSSMLNTGDKNED